MTSKRKIVLALITAVLLLCLTACGAEVLPVKSADYEGLTELTAAKPPSEENISLWYFSPANPYDGYFCYLTVDGDGLHISADIPPETDSYTLKGNNGYFVGTDIGEFDGWVKYFPYYSASHPEIVGEPEDVVDENCLGFIKIDNTHGYLITWMYKGMIMEAYDDIGGAVYELRFPDGENSWQCTKIADLMGKPYVYDYDPDSGIIYVATTTSLLSVSTKDRTCTKLADLSLYRSPTSVVRWNGKIYTGMPMGIVEYDPAAGDTKWYPLPYEKLIPKEKWNPEYDEESARMYKELGFYVSDLSDD